MIRVTSMGRKPPASAREGLTATVLRRWCEPDVILVVTNLHDEEPLMPHVIRQARKSGAKVLLAHVAHPIRQPSSNVLRYPSGRTISSAHRPQAVLERMTRQLQWEGIPCELVLLTGLAEEEIPALARSCSVDRVILTTHGDRVAGRFNERWIAERLLPALEVPVCVIGRCVPVRSRHEKPTGRVSLAMSLQSNCDACLGFASRFAQGYHAQLTVLHVSGARAEDDLPMAREPGAAAAHIPESALVEAGLWCPLDIAVRQGDPAGEILKYNSTTEKDFLILGASGTPVPRTESVSLIQKVVSEARCPVIVLSVAIANESSSLTRLSSGASASCSW